MKKIQLFFATIFSLFLIASLTSCGGNSGERQPTDVCFEHKNTIEKMDDQIAQLELSLQNCREEKVYCADNSIHSTPLKSLENADRNISYKVLYIENIPVYDSDDSGEETKIGIYTTALIRSEDKLERDIYVSVLYLDDENGNDAPKVKAGDIVWIEDVNIGEGTTETTLIKK